MASLIVDVSSIEGEVVITRQPIRPVTTRRLLGQSVEQKRNRRKMSQQALAEAVGLNRRDIANLENGYLTAARRITLGQLRAIAKQIGAKVVLLWRNDRKAISYNRETTIEFIFRKGGRPDLV